jgi:hypothetical protein
MGAGQQPYLEPLLVSSCSAVQHIKELFVTGVICAV